MNVVREIQRINQQELDIAINNPSASWHQQYKDSAYIFIGGLPYDLTEGDVITIFSQYGEVVDVNLPRSAPPQQGNSSGGGRAGSRDGSTLPSSSSATTQQQQQERSGKGKHRGFGFLMYEDQRSTVLAVDNLNGASILGRTIRVDHVAEYKQQGSRDEEGRYVEPDQPSLNAAPEKHHHHPSSSATPAVNDEEEGDVEDPMASYFPPKRAANGEGEREEKRKRKEERERIRAERAARRADRERRRGDGAGGETERSRRRSRDEESEDGGPPNRYYEAKTRWATGGVEGERRRDRSPVLRGGGKESLSRRGEERQRRTRSRSPDSERRGEGERRGERERERERRDDERRRDDDWRRDRRIDDQRSREGRDDSRRREGEHDERRRDAERDKRYKDEDDSRHRHGDDSRRRVGRDEDQRSRAAR